MPNAKRSTPKVQDKRGECGKSKKCEKVEVEFGNDSLKKHYHTVISKLHFEFLHY
jgi:hypothetical protein